MSSQSPHQATENSQWQKQPQVNTSPESSQYLPSQPATDFPQQPEHIAQPPDPQPPGYIVQPPYPPVPPPVIYPPAPRPKNGMAIAGLVLGIVGMLTSWVLVGLPFCVAGLVLGIMGMRGAKGKGTAIAGIVFSSIGLIVGIGATVVWIALFSRTSIQSTPTQNVTTTAPARQVTPTSTLSAKDNYKAAAKTMTITELVQSGDSNTNMIVHFQGIVVMTTTASDGTPVAVIADPGDSAKQVAVAFAKGTDLSKIANADTVEIWGQDWGMPQDQASSMLSITAQYFTDHTSEYSQ